MGKLLTGVLVLAVAGTASAQVVQDAGRDTLPAQPGAEEIQRVERGDQANHIALAWNESVEEYLDYFCGPARRSFQKWLDNSTRFLPLMKEIFRDKNLPEELVYVSMIESGFSPEALSPAKAAGPWQLMPATAREYGLRSDIWRDERKDPAKSTRAAARIFRDLYDRLNSWPLVIAAYNAGIGRVQRALIATGADDFWDLKNTRHLKRESRNFVPKFMAAARIAQDPARYGFRVRPSAAFDPDHVVLGDSADLALIASWTGATYRKIKSLNPEINGRFTPPGDPLYVVNIPPGTKRLYASGAAISRTVLRKRPHSSFLPIPIRHGEAAPAVFFRADACSFTGPLHEHMHRAPASLAIADLFLQAPVSLNQGGTGAGRVLALCDRR